METGIARLNQMPAPEFRELMRKCCGASSWAEAMTEARPFESYSGMCDRARTVWSGLGPAGWKEAFSHHPKIGDISSLRSKFAATADMASREQSGVKGASDEILERLAEGNRRYEEKFGYIFIVCASGKSAAEMLAILDERLRHNPEEEIKIAAEENLKITFLRLKRLTE